MTENPEENKKRMWAENFKKRLKMGAGIQISRLGNWMAGDEKPTNQNQQANPDNPAKLPPAYIFPAQDSVDYFLKPDEENTGEDSSQESEDSWWYDTFSWTVTNLFNWMKAVNDATIGPKLVVLN